MYNYLESLLLSAKYNIINSSCISSRNFHYLDSNQQKTGVLLCYDWLDYELIGITAC